MSSSITRRPALFSIPRQPVTVLRDRRIALEEDHTWNDERDLLVCPVCGFDYVHIGDLRHTQTTKGSYLIISFWGECGHSFDIEVLQHKGQTTLRAVNIRQSPEGGLAA